MGKGKAGSAKSAMPGLWSRTLRRFPGRWKRDGMKFRPQHGDISQNHCAGENPRGDNLFLCGEKIAYTWPMTGPHKKFKNIIGVIARKEN